MSAAPAYECPLFSRNRDGTGKEPGFSFVDLSGDPMKWEHLGKFDTCVYAQGEPRRLQWNADNGFAEGDNILTTTKVGGFDAGHIAAGH